VKYAITSIFSERIRVSQMFKGFHRESAGADTGRRGVGRGNLEFFVPVFRIASQ